jgi:sugar/nucleoside kinase (ribokinase family)
VTTSPSPSIPCIGVGNPIVDILARVDDAFLKSVSGGKGGMVLVSAPDLDQLMARIPGTTASSPGGSAGNTLFAMARIGMPVAFIGKIGNDRAGDFYRDRFAALGGDPSRFKRGTIANGRCLSLITADGERTLRTDLGAAVTLAPSEVSAADFSGCRHAHIEGYLGFNPELFATVLASAKSAGCTISVDLASYEVVHALRDSLPELLGQFVDVVFANEDEAAAYFGSAGTPADHARTLARLCPVAVVKVGKSGAWIADNTGCHHAPAVSGVDAIDTTGAGDFWAAGFLAGWLGGHGAVQSGWNGSLLAAAVVQQVGTTLPDPVWDALIPRLAL